VFFSDIPNIYRFPHPAATCGSYPPSYLRQLPASFLPQLSAQLSAQLPAQLPVAVIYFSYQHLLSTLVIYSSYQHQLSAPVIFPSDLPQLPAQFFASVYYNNFLQLLSADAFCNSVSTVKCYTAISRGGERGKWYLKGHGIHNLKSYILIYQ
jgi:hypothetical protein